LSMVTPTGPDGLITAADIQRVANVLKQAGPAEELRGVRRAMARNMALAHAEVVPATLVDDADIHAWPQGTDTTIRLVRAIVAGVKAEPALNVWYDSKAGTRRLVSKIEIGIAVDTPEGLFVPTLRDVGNRDAGDLRRGLDRMRADVKERKLPPEELRGAPAERGAGAGSASARCRARGRRRSRRSRCRYRARRARSAPPGRRRAGRCRWAGRRPPSPCPS